MPQTSSDQVRQLVIQGRERELSEKLILDALRENDIQDFKQFVERSVQVYKESRPLTLADMLPGLKARNPEDIVVELLFGKNAQNNAKTSKHKEPKLPFVLGNAYYKSSEIERFNERPLHYIWDTNLTSEGFLRAVTDQDEYRSFFTDPQPRGNPNWSFRSHVPATGHLFFEHINFGGRVLGLAYRHAWPDLTKVAIDYFLWWITRSWNDQISSLITGSGPVLLAADVLLPGAIVTGPTMTVGAYTSIPYIGVGWNDRVSCIIG